MNQIKFLVLAGVMAMLCACASAPVTQLDPDQQSADPTYAAATLASYGSFEYEAAPAFTRNVALRHRSVALARAGKISAEALDQSISNGDRARALLDKALAADRAHNGVQAHQFLGDAIAVINSAEVALNAGVKQ